MAKHSETRALPHHARDMYDLVADIGRYPEFLPWCVEARIVSTSEDQIIADLLIGFRLFRERFRSRVDLDPENLAITVTAIQGPVRHLETFWAFQPQEAGCLVDFRIDFEFRSLLLRSAMQPLFHEAVRRMVTAFEMRARRLYGN